MKNIFTARTVEIEYTSGQKEALEKIENFLASAEKFFLLAGYSGCGKTTIAENIVKYSNARVLAPTNAAVNRLREKINISSDRFGTIHSEMYSPTDVKGVFRKEKGLRSSTNYVIDEASMIDEFILKDLIEEAYRKNCKIIFMGDGFQLEPVGTDPKLFNWSRPEFNIENQYELTEVKRYDGDLLKIATELRTRKEAIFTLPESNDLVIVPKFTSQLIKDFRENKSAIVLTSTNERRTNYNKQIRAMKYNQVDNLMYAQHNDNMVSVSNNSFYSNGETFKMNYPQLVHEFDIVVDAAKSDDLITYKVLLYKNNNTLIIVVPYLMEPSLHGTQIANSYVNRYFNLPHNIDQMLFLRTKDGSKTWLNKNIVIATYGYAISCHKAQGQEWDNVYIDADYLSSVWDKARWFYTAITRAKLKVQIKTNKYLTTNE